MRSGSTKKGNEMPHALNQQAARFFQETGYRLIGSVVAIAALSVLFTFVTGYWVAGLGNGLTIMTLFWAVMCVVAVSMMLDNKLSAGTWFRDGSSTFSKEETVVSVALFVIHAMAFAAFMNALDVRFVY